MCVCIPEPCTPSSGLGMNVAWTPWDAATSRTSEAERHHAVGHRHGVGVPKVDLLLARRILVEAVLDRDAHRLERADRLLAQRAGDVVGGEIEVARVVERLAVAAPRSAPRSRRTRCPGRRRRSGRAVGGLDVALEHLAASRRRTGVPSRLLMSQKIRASGVFGSPQGSSSNVFGIRASPARRLPGSARSRRSTTRRTSCRRRARSRARPARSRSS